MWFISLEFIYDVVIYKLNRIVKQVHEEIPINVLHMEAGNDVANRIVKQVHKANPINVEHTEEEKDVMNRIVKNVQKVKPINVSHMEAENDVRIVRIGPIQDVVL